ncbi:MAG: prefoldin subunit alpha [Candidatus Thalassarchaeaceae archaeon]|tara:strand:- start:71 stop:583 length:513 start_codon:yes stop_codon:yes gene_type:complete
MEPDETRRITRLIEANHSRQEALRAQLERLSALLDEQTRAQGTLEAAASKPNKRTLIPLGSGVQIPVTIEEGALPIIDIGSGVQIETNHDKAIEMLNQRNTELTNLIENMVEESRAIESTILELTNQIEKHQLDTNLETPIQSTDQEPSQNQPKKRAPRRKRGTELTLDD